MAERAENPVTAFSEAEEIGGLRVLVERLSGDPKFRVGDLVSRDGTDVQRVIEVDDDYFCILVECIKEPLGFLNEDGTRGAPWCKVGDREHNLSRRYGYAGGVLNGNATIIAGALCAPGQS